MSDTNDMRQEFEAFVAKRYGFGASDFAHDAESNTYVSVNLENEWEFWQAATERAAKVCENKRVGSAHDTDEFQVGYNMGVNDCAVAIRQGGAG